MMDWKRWEADRKKAKEDCENGVQCDFRGKYTKEAMSASGGTYGHQYIGSWCQYCGKKQKEK